MLLIQSFIQWDLSLVLLRFIANSWRRFKEKLVKHSRSTRTVPSLEYTMSYSLQSLEMSPERGQLCMNVQGEGPKGQCFSSDVLKVHMNE